MTLDNHIEALLFFKGEPVAIKKIASLLKKEESEIEEAIKELEKKLEGRGLTLVYHDRKVMLGTNSKLSGFITELSKDELEKELGKAGLETLSVILYKGPISKKEIDYIRGVNSSYILRNLLIRGLVERDDEIKKRGNFYKPTIELLTFLNLNKIEDLPEYEKSREELESLKSEEQSEE